MWTANDPPDNMVANFTVGFSTVNACTLSYTPIYDIQGSGLNAAITGTSPFKVWLSAITKELARLAWLFPARLEWR